MIFYENYNVKEVIENTLLKRVSDIDRYVWTIENVHNTNVAQDRSYQKKFNRLYRIRQKSAEWYQCYYEIFEQAKINTYSFEKIITELYERTGNIEPSFTSKMVATLNPDMPIWDKFVLQNLNMKLKGSIKEIRLKNAIELYYVIVEQYKTFLKTDEAYKWTEEFDRLLSNYTYITPTKKVDFILWSIRNNDN